MKNNLLWVLGRSTASTIIYILLLPSTILSTYVLRQFINENSPLMWDFNSINEYDSYTESNRIITTIDTVDGAYEAFLIMMLMNGIIAVSLIFLLPIYIICKRELDFIRFYIKNTGLDETKKKLKRYYNIDELLLYINITPAVLSILSIIPYAIFYSASPNLLLLHLGIMSNCILPLTYTIAMIWKLRLIFIRKNHKKHC